jgi:hypothetical protein
VKGILRIGGALAFGILIILGAFVTQNKSNSEALTGQIIVSQEPNREYIPTNDSDGDGNKDWKNSLEGFETIETPTEVIESIEPYTPPTTLTGRFSEAFLQDFLEGKMNGEDFSDPSKIVGNAVDAIDTNSLSKRHTRAEFYVIEDSPEAIREYGNAIAFIMKVHSIDNENEMIILQNALSANNSEILSELEPIRTVYVRMITDSLKLNIPASLAEAHVNLLNAYEAIRTDIEAMQVSFTDPLYALARIRLYEEDATALYNAYLAIHKVLSDAGASYTHDEPGSLFYIFDT